MNLIGRICPLLVCSLVVAQQAPAPPAQTPAPTATAQAIPIAPEPESIERMMSIGLYDWLPSGGPKLRQGSTGFAPPSHDLILPTKPYRAYGVIVTFPTSGSSRLEFSYLTINDRGSAVAPADLGFFGGVLPKGEPLSNAYSIRHLKVSWNFLTYPNPPLESKLRIKTLWEFHYMRLYPSVEGTVSAPGLPLVATQSILLPAVGLGFEYVMSKHFRLETRGTGMAYPNHSKLADAEGSAVVRLGNIEIFAGAKYLQFSTSPKQEAFMKGTLWGPDGGVRWVFK